LENHEQHHIHVIDSPVGSGKTTAAISYINQLENNKKVIFITPFKSEIERVISQCKDKDIKQPDVKHGRGRKKDSFLKLIQSNENIASTHSLFMNVDDEIISSLKERDYILILDEAFNVVQHFDLWKDLKYITSDTKTKFTKGDLKSLINKKYIKIEDNYLVKWIDNENELKRYTDFKKLVDRGLIYFVNKSFLLWIFPHEVFSKDIFKEVFILTFQFDLQMQSYYYKYFGVEYDKFHVVDDGWGKYKFVKTMNNDHEIEWIRKIVPLIKIEDNTKLNAVGSFKNIQRNSSRYLYKGALSKGWYSGDPKLVDVIRKNTRRYFERIATKRGLVEPSDFMWTCFKNNIKELKDGRVSNKNWIALNARATNMYRNKSILSYPVNRYANPFIKHFFTKRGVEVDEDGLALSEMIQWIFRSRVRDGEKIDVYIPSQRMRELLIEYLKGE